MKPGTRGLNLSGLEQFKASRMLAGPAPSGMPLQVRLEQIDFDPLQPRRNIDPVALAALAETIKRQGVLEPVSLRPDPTRPGRYIVNRGERRVRASLLAKLREIPAFIDLHLDRYAQVIENLQREDLSLFDLAAFIADREKAGDSRAEIARRLGKPRSFITEVASLNEATTKLRAAYDQGQISDARTLYLLARHARERPEVVKDLLAGDKAVSRAAVEEALAPASAHVGARLREKTSEHRPRAAAPKPSQMPQPRASHLVEPGLVVEHHGRCGTLRWDAGPGKHNGQVSFDGGEVQTLPLAELTLVAWAAG